jgi:hypothetical protein
MTMLKLAVTLFAASMVTTQLPVPVHAPLQPAKVLPWLTVGVSVTSVPLGKLTEQVPGQSMPDGLDATAPLPVPAVLTERTNVGGGGALNVAVTLRAAVIATTQLPVPVHAPLQPANVLPFVGAAVSVTVVPEA